VIRTVQAGYDALAPCFGAWMEKIEGDPREGFVEELCDPPTRRGRVLVFMTEPGGVDSGWLWVLARRPS
jgi:hypothetical protein